MGFPRQQLDGTTSLAILVPGEGIDPKRPKERSVSLGQIVGRLKRGTGYIEGYLEDARNIVKPVKPLNYGAFGSYAPSYDSTFSNVTKEESNLLYTTYNESTTSQAESLLNVAKDSDYLVTMADNLLEVLGGGEKKPRPHEEDKPKKPAEDPLRVELEQLRSLSELGIDVSFLSEFERQEAEAGVDTKLEETWRLLERLQETQSRRLSLPLPQHLSLLPPPSSAEINLVDKVTESLTDLAKQVPPSVLAPLSAVRKAMGIPPE